MAINEELSKDAEQPLQATPETPVVQVHNNNFDEQYELLINTFQKATETLKIKTFVCIMEIDNKLCLYGDGQLLDQARITAATLRAFQNRINNMITA